jgi:oligoribonuclease
VVTNNNLEIIAEAPTWVVHQSDAVLGRMDEWNRNTHGSPA